MNLFPGMSLKDVGNVYGAQSQKGECVHENINL